ncbi:MAG TPA: hypothetical protein VN380_10365 [Thermoanaerobaculia bacterium]|jgi:hypothetical protein|nr:hypothetical protein [Thermoanaerobaculia bacterium]
MPFRLLLLVLLVPAAAAADGLADLRLTLSRLPATTPVHGTLDVTSSSRSSEEEKADDGKASVGFEIGESGLHIIYPHAMPTQAAQEARAEARDPERPTPVRSGAGHVRPIHVAELLDGAAALSILLESAQFVQTKPASFGGRPAHLLSFKLAPKMSKSESKHVKKLDGALSVWVGDDGTPLAAEASIAVKASFLLISFESEQKQSWTYARSGDRLAVVRYEANDKSDGLGQHSTTHTLELVRLE